MCVKIMDSVLVKETEVVLELFSKLRASNLKI